MRDEITGAEPTRARGRALLLVVAGAAAAAAAYVAVGDEGGTATSPAFQSRPAPSDRTLRVAEVRVAAARLVSVPRRPDRVVLAVDVRNPNPFSVTVGSVGTDLPGIRRMPVLDRPWVVPPSGTATLQVGFERVVGRQPCGGGDAELPVEVSVGRQASVWNRPLLLGAASWRDAVAARLCR